MGRYFCGLRVTQVRFASTWRRRSRHHQRGVVGKKLVEKDEDGSEGEDEAAVVAVVVA